MIPFSNNIQKALKAMSILILLIICTFTGKTQSEDFTMSIVVVNASTAESMDGSITIKTDINDNYIFMLFDKEPWEGGNEIAHNESAGLEYGFTNLKSGNYFVCVKNVNEVTRCQNITIKPNR